MFIIKCEAVLEDSMVPNVEEQRSNVFVKNLNVQFTNEDISILEKIRNVLLKETRERFPPLRGIEKHRLLEATRKFDEVVNKIKVGNITELNDFVYAGAARVTKMLRVKNRKSIGMKTS